MNVSLCLRCLALILLLGSCASPPQQQQTQRRTISFHEDSLVIAKTNRDLFTLASIRFEVRDYSSAIRGLRAMKGGYDTAAVDLLYAKCFQSMVQNDSALVYAQRVIAREPELEEAFLVLAQVQSSKGNFSEAAAAYEAACKIHPRLNTRFSLAQTYERMNDDRALTILRSLAALTDDVNVLFELAAYYENHHMNDEYVKVMEGIMNEFPAKALPFQDYFQSLLDTRSYTQALRILQSKSDTFSPDIRHDNRMRMAVRLYEDSTMHDSVCVNAMAEIVRTQDDSSAEAHEIVGLLYIKIQDSSAALEELLRVAEQDTAESSELRLCSYLVGANYLYTARRFCVELCRAQPQSPQRWLYRGMVEQAMQNVPEAENSFREVLRLDPTREDAWIQLAGLYDQQGARLQSDSCYRQCLSHNPLNITALNNLAYSYAEQGQHLDSAQAYIEQVLKVNDASENYLDTYGWVLYKRSLYERASPYLEQAVMIATEHRTLNATLLEHLGDNYAKLGKRVLAADAWKRAMELDASKTYLRERLLNSK